MFDVGEQVVYIFKGHPGLPAKIISRHREKDYFLSEAWGKNIFYNSYITETQIRFKHNKQTKIFRWNDPEKSLRTCDISKPHGAIDYESDEHTADWIDNNGKVLRTIKAGQIGLANDIVAGRQTKNCH